MQIQTGTAGVTNADATIIASNGNDWSQATANSVFSVPGDDILYTIATVSAPGVSVSGFWELELTTPYLGATDATADYQITKDFTPNWGFPIISPGDIETALLFNRALLLIDQGMPTPVSTATVSVVAIRGVIPLKALVSATARIETIYDVYEPTTGETSRYILVAGTLAADVVGEKYKGDDYNAVTNARHYIRIPS